MQKVWADKFAEAAVDALRESVLVVDWPDEFDCPEEVRRYLGLTTGAWTVHSYHKYRWRLMWTALEHLRLGDFLKSIDNDEQEFSYWGLLKRNLDWLDLEKCIRKKVLECLHSLRDAKPAAAKPVAYCARCLEYVWMDASKLCKCKSRLHELLSLKWGLKFHIRLTKHVCPHQMSRCDVRNFLNYFAHWVEKVKPNNGRLRMVRIDGDGLLFALQDRLHAALTLGDRKHTLNGRTCARLTAIVSTIDSTFVEFLGNEELHIQTQLAALPLAQ
jgi:hypothetical protein